MRPKIVLIVLVVAGMALAGMILLKRPAMTPAPVSEPIVVAANPAETNAIVVEKPVVATNPPPQIAATTNTAPEYGSVAAHQKAIDDEKNRLSTLAMNSDTDSLSNILTDLNSPDREVRMAAIEATKQFESTNAIPALRAAAMNADPDEAVAMLKAVSWLSIPSVDMAPSGGFTKPDLTADQSQAIQANQARAAIRKSANAAIKATKQTGQSGATDGNNGGANPGQSQTGPGSGGNTGATGPTQ
jgi:hypothetical protein